MKEWQGQGGRHDDSSYSTARFRESVNEDVSTASVTERCSVNVVSVDINLGRFCSQATQKFGDELRVKYYICQV